MFIKGLKLHIFFILTVLLGIGMVSISLVFTYFWQRSLINSEMLKVTSLVEIFKYHKQSYSDFQECSKEDLENLCKAIGPSCENVIMYGENQKTVGINEIQNSYTKQIDECLSKQQPVIVKEEVMWNLFFLQDKVLMKFYPCLCGCKKEFVLGVRLNFSHLSKQIGTVIHVMAFYIVINSLILATIGFFRFVKIIIKPIDKLIDISENYSNFSSTGFLKQSPENEFGKLSFALNNMIARINEDKLKLEDNVATLKSINNKLRESQEKMIRAEKMAAVGKLSAGLAHEIGNPIGIAQGYVELLENDDLTQDEREQYSNRAVKELERVDKMIRQLLDFSRKKNSQDEIVSIGAVVQDVYSMLQTHNHGLVIEVCCDVVRSEDEVAICYDDLYQVLINCVFNSFDAIRDRGKGFLGKIELFSEKVMHDGRAYIQIKLVDNGIGIPSEEMNSVFDPFFTTKDVGKGTGLGLSVSYSIIETGGGTMELDSEYGKGTVVTLLLPVSEQ